MTDHDHTRRFSDGGFAPPSYDGRYEPQVRPMPAAEQVPEWSARPRGAASPAAIDAAQGAPQARPEPVREKRIELSRSYSNQGEDVRVVVLRKPTPGDLKRIGYPQRLIVNPHTQQVEGIDPLPDRIARYIQELSSPQLLPSTIDRLEFEDFEVLSGAVTSFFTS